MNRWPYSSSMELDVHVADGSHVCVYGDRQGEDGGVSL